MRWTSLFACLVALLAPYAATAQKLTPDPDRIFVTSLKWERVGGAPRSVKTRVADATLAILYVDGTYAEVSASILKTPKHPLSLDLNSGFILRVGKWSRTDDDQLIRIEQQDVLRDKVVLKLSCKDGDGACSSSAETPLPGPVVTRTCRLERPSSTHIADGFLCSDKTEMHHLQELIALDDLPQMVESAITHRVQ